LGEPEAKQNVLDAIDSCREALTTIGSTENSNLSDYGKKIEEIVGILEGLKEKVFLKTKKALTPAYLVLESSQNVADLAEEMDAEDDDDVREFGEAISQVKENVTKLQGASKQHSVIVT
jgi:hypothetical protein